MSHQRGNILFLILLAVILFAALSYAVTSSLRGGGKDGSDENASLLASQLVQYGTLVEQTILRLRMTNSCTETQIDLDNSVVSGFTNTTLPPAKCKVFNPSGGGIAYQQPNPKALDTYFSASPWGAGFIYGMTAFPYNIRYVNLGTVNADLMMLIPYIRDDVCREINTKLGLPSVIVSDPYIMDLGWRFDGTYVNGYNIEIENQSGTIYNPVPHQACVTGEWAAANPEPGKTFNAFMQVLIAR